MAKPKQLWWVEFKANGTQRTRYRHYGPKGGKFSSLQAAKNRRDAIRREWPDAEIKLYGTGPINWTEVS